MQIVKINGISYPVEQLNDEVKGHLQRLAYIDAEAERIRLQLDVLRVARDEIGSRLDRALLHMELNQPRAAGGTAGGVA